MDLFIAAWLALFALLPTGPTYLGLDWPWALEVFFLFSVGAGLLILLTDRRREPTTISEGTGRSIRLLRRGYLIWLIPVAGATLLGMLERIPADVLLWRAEVGGLLDRLGRPMNQAVDPLYPLRVGLIFLEGGLMFWLLSSLLRRTSQPARRARMALRGCLTGVALVSGVAVVQYLTGVNLHEYWVRMNPELVRSHATLDDPNALASYLVLGIGLAGGVVWSAAPRPVGATIVTTLALAALVTTVSRAGWAGLVLAGLVCVALWPDALVGRGRAARLARRTARGLGAAAIVAMLVWTVLFVTLPKRATPVVPSTPLEAALQTIDPRESIGTILKGREVIWLAGMELTRSQWALGAGLGAFPRFLATYPGAGGPENAHNFFLQVLAEAGTIGLVALVLLLVGIVTVILPAVRDRHVAVSRFALGASTGLLAFVLTWLTGHPLLNLSNQLWMASVLAVALSVIGTSSAPGLADPEASAPHALPPARVWLLQPIWVFTVIAVTVAAAVPRLMAAARKDASVSLAAGVYGWESGPATDGAPADPRFRWTRGRAALREPVGGSLLTIPLYVARPLPATLRVVIDGVAVDPVTLSQTGWQTLTCDLSALLRGRGPLGETIALEFQVSPTFVPARAGPSDDTRELGVGVGVVRWSGSDGAHSGRK